MEVVEKGEEEEVRGGGGAESRTTVLTKEEEEVGSNGAANVAPQIFLNHRAFLDTLLQATGDAQATTVTTLAD
ncbi:hypothetical protein E2C01_079140 [Portunus trituberculatus]|uniref:Uncharacterized protein n=1 Tax=Portunus trituberculatus TaxID=210409 RepID=A0A5B7IKP8_PORTR|nr:hypothetical protein [Portunus trituberculatus]